MPTVGSDPGRKRRRPRCQAFELIWDIASAGALVHGPFDAVLDCLESIAARKLP